GYRTVFDTSTLACTKRLLSLGSFITVRTEASSLPPPGPSDGAGRIHVTPRARQCAAPGTTMMNPLVTRLRTLTSLTEDDLQLLARACGLTLGVAARTDIHPEGYRPDSLHILVEGWAARFKLLPDGRRQIPAVFVPGDVCDLDGLLLKRIHSGVCALTACTVAVLPLTQVRELMDRSPAIREAIWWLQCVENAVSAEWSIGLGRRSADERMAHLLCELLVRLSTVGLSSENRYPLPVTQADLGDALGLSTVHVNRTLQELRGRGLISLEGRWLTIHDYDAVKAIAGFDSDYLHIEGPRPMVERHAPARLGPDASVEG
ncbi:Crp/Fnr family transcriptional regulator, partial [Methylobacterium isbiliense]